MDNINISFNAVRGLALVVLKSLRKRLFFFDVSEVIMIRNQKGRRNVATFVMIELGLKLEDRLWQKGLENKATCSFDKLVDKEKTLLEISTKPLVTKNENSTIKEKIDTREEIAKFANTSSNTIAKVKKIKEKAPEEVIQKLRDSEISINQAYTTIRREEKNAFAEFC